MVWAFPHHNIHPSPRWSLSWVLMPAGPTHRIQIKGKHQGQPRPKPHWQLSSSCDCHSWEPSWPPPTDICRCSHLMGLKAGLGPFQNSDTRITVAPAEAADNAVGRIQFCLLHGPPTLDPSASMIQEGRPCSCCWSHCHPTQASQPSCLPGIQLCFKPLFLITLLSTLQAAPPPPSRPSEDYKTHFLAKGQAIHLLNLPS